MSNSTPLSSNKRVLISVSGDFDGSIVRELTVLQTIDVLPEYVSILSLDTPHHFEKSNNIVNFSDVDKKSDTVTWPDFSSY